MKEPIPTGMSPARWEELKAAFAQAMDRNGHQRDLFLAGIDERDPDLAGEVRRLLSGHECAGEFLSRPAIVVSDARLPQSFESGQVISHRYRIVRFIARGGMGEVYEAEDLVLAEKVAVKTIRPQIAAGASLEILKQEMQSARRVTHPNACRIHDIVEDSEPSIVTMELLDGPTLSCHLREHGPFSRLEALPLICQIAAGLQAAHNGSIIHRDLKPGNIILTRSPVGWRPVITDYGLALSLGSAPRPLEVHGGTPGYMAPEQLSGGLITPATDVYSFGMVIAQMIGVRPDVVQDRRLLGPWRGVIERCLERDPAKRYQRPADVATALDRASAGLLSRRNIAATAIAVSLVAILSMVAWQSRPRQPQWLLVTALDNRTGEALLDESVPFLLEREISNGGSVYVAPRPRVEDTLQLMRKDTTARVDQALGREVCLRDGGIRLIATSRATRVGTAYLLNVGVIEAASGRLLGGGSEQARTLEEIAPAVHRLAGSIRRAAGDTIQNEGTVPLQRVTTSSLRALQVYSEARRESIGDWAVRERITREALAHDPQFASAWLWLAWAMHNQQKPWSEVKVPLERAVALSNLASDRERQFILASQQELMGHDEEAMRAYQRMLARYPDDYWANNNLVSILRRLGKTAARAEAGILADLRPNQWRNIWGLLPYLVVWGDIEAARKNRDRLARIVETNPNVIPERSASSVATFLHGFRLHELWVAEKLDELKAEVDRSAHSGAMSKVETANLASFYETLGRLRDADAVVRLDSGTLS